MVSRQQTLILLLALFVCIAFGLRNGINLRNYGIVTSSQLSALSPAITPTFSDDLENENEQSRRSNSFDSDFAEAISKPLPQWYKDSLVEREKLMEEIKRNRERIIQEFKAKYIDVSEEEKLSEKRRIEERFRKRLNERKKKSSEKNWFQKAVSLGSKKDSLFTEDSDVVLEAEDDSDISTKEKWDLFWKEEEKQTGFNLPGFFEVFPELKLKWPIWARKKDGSALRCEADADCPIPTVCCKHPIIPGEKFCCTGWGKRVMVPAYALQEIAPDQQQNPSKQSGGNKERENWRPSE